jgi:diguanylate cyclase (GGDEF)-like protein
MIDVDFFKAINDKFGHPYGDKVLINVSKAIKNSLRPTDYAGRYGGEEFIVVLPNTDKEKAKEISESIRKNIKDIYLKNGNIVTVSGGLYENDTYIKQQCIENADKLLYIAKNSGRDRIAV